MTLICRDDGAWLSRETAERIVAETGGAVTPNDFLLNPPAGRKGYDMNHPVTQAIEAFARGEIVVVTDDDDRENEGDMIVAASLCTTEAMAFIIRNGCGIVCAPLTAEDARRLNLPPMVAANDAPLGTAFTVSVDVKHGMTTGISAEQRCNTVRALANDNMGASDFVRPGHVFPLIAKEGGVLMRSGHTEAAIDLCRLANLPPVAVICELANDDGTVMVGPQIAAFAEKHGLKRISVADLIAYRQGARKAGRALRDLSGQDADRRTPGLRLPDAFRLGHAFRLRPWIGRRRPRHAGAASSLRHHQRRLRKRLDPQGPPAIQGRRARGPRLPAGRVGGRAGEFRRLRSRPVRTTPAPSNGARWASARRFCATSASRRSGSGPTIPRTYVGLSGFGIEIASVEPIEG